MDLIKQAYKEWIRNERECFGDKTEQFDKDFSEQDKRYAFLASEVFGLTTYDLDLDIEFGKDIFEVMKVIYERKNFEYIKNETNYKKYILVCNLLNDNGWIEWGTSIRGAWFNNFDSIQFNDCSNEEIQLTDEFLKWFFKFIDCK